MTADEAHRPGDDGCEHCESQQPSALQRAMAVGMALVQRTEVIRGIVLGGTLFLAFTWFQLTSVRQLKRSDAFILLYLTRRTLSGQERRGPRGLC